ncbi:adaptin ear-binding coat-associated protein 1-like isoform 2-T2 [Liasis olivaceus]
MGLRGGHWPPSPLGAPSLLVRRRKGAREEGNQPQRGNYGLPPEALLKHEPICQFCFLRTPKAKQRERQSPRQAAVQRPGQGRLPGAGPEPQRTFAAVGAGTREDPCSERKGRAPPAALGESRCPGAGGLLRRRRLGWGGLPSLGAPRGPLRSPGPPSAPEIPLPPPARGRSAGLREGPGTCGGPALGERPARPARGILARGRLSEAPGVGSPTPSAAPEGLRREPQMPEGRSGARLRVGAGACALGRKRRAKRTAPSGRGAFRIQLVGAMAAAEAEYESVLCVKPEVSVFRIPPRASNRGYRASDWKLDQPDWTGRLRVTSKGKIAYVKLEDKVSGELFAQAPIDQYPGIAVETVNDSSRYFVIRIQDGNGRSAFIGIGFGDRGDAFDFNVALQDHFKWVKQETEISKESQELDSRPKLDLGFKEGQTIKLNIGNMPTKKSGSAKPRPTGSGGLSLLPPPPGGKMAPPPVPPLPSTAIANHVTPPPVLKSGSAGNTDVLLDFDLPSPASKGPTPAIVPTTADLWGDFNTAPSTVPSQSPQPSNWVQF